MGAQGRAESLHRHRSGTLRLDIAPVGRVPDDETMRTRIVVIDLACPSGCQVIGKSSLDAKHVITVDSTSREHAGLRRESGELTPEDLGHAGDTTLDGKELVKGLGRPGAGLTLDGRDVAFATHFLKERD